MLILLLLFSTKSCPTLYNPTGCSRLGFPLTTSKSLLKLMSIVSVIPSNLFILYFPSPPAQNLSQYLGFFSMTWVFASGGQSIGASAYQSLCCRKGDQFQGLKRGSCLTLRNVLSKEMHVLTKQEILSGKGPRVESRRVGEHRRTALPYGLQSQVLW